MQQREIRISETETHYRLFIPKKQKDRARNIKGRPSNNWNTECKYWWYPRTLDMYYALIKEFADDLTSSSSFTNPQEDEQKRLWQNTITDNDEKIKKLKTRIRKRDKENRKLKKQVDQLNEETTTKDSEIKSLESEGKKKDRDNAELQGEVKRQHKINAKNAESIGSLDNKISTKDSEIKSKDEKIELLESNINQTNSENERLKTQVAQLQDLNSHPELRDIAVKAAGNDQEFRTLKIDDYLPIDREEWLERRLNQTLGKHNVGLYNLIDKHIDFDENLNPDALDYSDSDLAYMIKTQRNVLAHPKKMKKDTVMARVYCCFFAAALLSSKLPKSDHTSTSTKSIEPKSDNAKVYYDSGLDYAKKGNHNLAIDEYTKAIELNPNYADAHLYRGNTYHAKKDYDRAIKDYTKAIELKSDYVDAYLYRGNAYDDKGDYDHAIVDYTKAIELKPDDADAYRCRGHAYKKKAILPALKQISTKQNSFNNDTLADSSQRLCYFQNH